MLALRLWLGSDSGGEQVAVLYSLFGTCRLNNVEPEKWLRYVIEYIKGWPADWVRDLLPWHVELTAQEISIRFRRAAYDTVRDGGSHCRERCESDSFTRLRKSH